MLSRGFRMLAYGGDLWLYQQALRQGHRSWLQASKTQGLEGTILATGIDEIKFA